MAQHILCIYEKIKPKLKNFGFLAGAEGLDSRANCALGLPRSRTSTGSPLCTVSPSSPPTHAQNNKRAIAYATTLSLFWQGQKDLNPRPMVLETSTLPTELYPCATGYIIPYFFKKSKGFFKKSFCFFDFFRILQKNPLRLQVTCIKYLDSTQNMWYNSRMEKDFSPILPPFPRRIPS